MLAWFEICAYAVCVLSGAFPFGCAPLLGAVKLTGEQAQLRPHLHAGIQCLGPSSSD